jgi:membrane-associated phospholipid phosphatase
MNLPDMVNMAAHADAAAFRFINHTLYWRPLADATYWTANDYCLMGFLIVGAFGYWFFRGWRTALVVGIWSGFAVLFSNLLHNAALKPFFNRARPFLTQPDVHLSAYLKDLSAVSLSFPSTHASSAAALAMVIAHLDPGLRFPAWAFALCIGWGAIYSGGHYPADVLAGYAIGFGLGWVLVKFSQWTWPGPQGVSKKG